ncbi:MAG: DUF3857 domain-containing protein [Bacteroidetes bacterium]|nr:DUF3857 domain-containing protein [Bacteroidota bacterium]
MRITYLIVLSLALSFTHPIFAQKDKSPKKTELEKTLEKGRDQLKSEIHLDDSILKFQAVPDKWKNESAVILLNYIAVQHVNAKKQPVGEASREYHFKRILLQDHFAINDFSEFELEENQILEVKVIKPNGDTILLDKSKAVSDEIRIEDRIGYYGFYLPDFTNGTKIPVPGLEPGDIIEIEQYYENVFSSYTSGVVRTFWRDYYNLRRLNLNYPVCYHVMDFKLSKNIQFNWKSMNGAPEIQKSKGDKNNFAYRFVDSMRDRNKAEFWSPGTVTFPFVKYSISRFKSGKSLSEFGNTSKGKALQKVRKSQIKDLIYSLEYKNEELTHSHVMRDFTLKYAHENMDPETYVNKFYEYYRAYYHFEVADDPEDVLNNFRFVLIMKRILQKKNLEYDYVVGIPRQFGALDDIISVNEITIGLRIHETGQILQVFNVYSLMGEVSNSLKGTEVFIVKPAKSSKKIHVSRDTLPQAPSEENTYLYEVNAKLLPGYQKIEVENKVTLKGYARYGYVRDMPYTIFQWDLNTMFGEDYLQVGTNRVWYEDMDREEYQSEKQRRDTTLTYELNKASLKKLKNSHRNKYYEIKDYNKFELIENGRLTDAPQLRYKEEYVVEGLCGQAGAYYVLDLGRLLGQQLEIIDSEDSIRNQDIYFGYPRVISYKLRFELPIGMKVSGLEAFNIDVDNESGSYTMVARQEGNMIIIEASKTYKQVLLNKSEWTSVKSFIDAAVDLNSKRIVLTR